jgi:hypothetical protein
LKAYTANWESHAGHSEVYESKIEGFSQTNRLPEKADPAPPATDGFVASKKSQVFHKAGCPAADKISEKNLVHCDSRDKAVDAGKRPCKKCNP